MPWHVDLDYESHEAARKSFEWDVPDDYDIPHDLLGKHEDPDAPALYQAYPDGRRETYTFAELDRLSDEIAAGLAARGVGRGDRVGVVLPQVSANPLTHLACWKLAAVTLPLSVLFGPDGLEARLDDSESVAVVCDASVSGAVREAANRCSALERVVELRASGGWLDGDGVADGGPDETADATDPRDRPADPTDPGDPSGDATVEPFAALLHDHEPVETAEAGPDTPAVVLYTSGSTGPPKGVLHTHDVWVGHCPAFHMYVEHDVTGTYWTPADWAWIGALGDLLFPAWHYGQPVVGYPMDGFDPALAWDLMAEFDVTDAFLPPTAIRMLMQDDPGERDLSLSTICSGGEPLTPEILDWAGEELGDVTVNELYGQTEANLLVANCRSWFPARPGSMGKPVPGHEVEPIDPETGERAPVDEVGHLAVRRAGDPVVFEEYWNAPERTAAVTVTGPDGDEWHLTGDLGSRDADGYLWFKARDDDVIITAGYRVGPGEVESAILEHPDVEQVGVVGVPHETRNEVIKAFVQPTAGVEPGDELREEIRTQVRADLAKHEYPREIAFVDELPTTTTGKIQRRKLRNDE